VFGDDRVCVTREHMMLQVDLVRHRAGAWASLGTLYFRVLLFCEFKDFVIVWIIELDFYIWVYKLRI